MFSDDLGSIETYKTTHGLKLLKIAKCDEKVNNNDSQKLNLNFESEILELLFSKKKATCS